MDLLDDVLRQAGLKRRILHQSSFADASALKFPCEKSLGFHVVTRGTAYIHLPDRAMPIALMRGDVALMARGCNHVVSTEATPPEHVSTMTEAGEEAAPRASDVSLVMVSGAYQLWNSPVHPFFAELPEWYVLRSDELQRFDQLQLAIDLLAEEVSRPSVGSDTVTQSLLDVMFTFIIRRILARRGEENEVRGWGWALQDAQIRAALEFMHANCAHGWTVDELARRVGLSRAGFAQKFKRRLGVPPLGYLTTLRVQKAMDLLSATEDKLEAVADAVGYKDAFGFSKAFKKITGMPPREFRLKDRREKDAEWRFN